jgi:hypothetical protein
MFNPSDASGGSTHSALFGSAKLLRTPSAGGSCGAGHHDPSMQNTDWTASDTEWEGYHTADDMELDATGNGEQQSGQAPTPQLIQASSPVEFGTIQTDNIPVSAR